MVKNTGVFPIGFNMAKNPINTVVNNRRTSDIEFMMLLIFRRFTSKIYAVRQWGNITVNDSKVNNGILKTNSWPAIFNPGYDFCFSDPRGFSGDRF
jgi:hypothetical protein